MNKMRRVFYDIEYDYFLEFCVVNEIYQRNLKK